MSRNSNDETYDKYNDTDLQIAELEKEFRLMRIRREQAHRVIKGRDATSGRDTTKSVKPAKRVLGRDSRGKAIHQGD
eukprot:1791939-Ditylum_brightwellii.AAC.1